MTTVRARVKIPVGDDASNVADFVSFNELTDKEEHVALVFGDADTQKSPLVRIHSECLTGDIFHSARCDCGKQLDEAVKSMSKQGGVLLYLRQEGRGIGLYNKLDAYRLQDDGLDTYAANKQLGFDHDLRDFTAAAQMLQALGIDKIQLLTNNPEKIAAMTKNNIQIVEQVETGVFTNRHNQGYLKAKVDIAKHAINLDPDEDSSK